MRQGEYPGVQLEGGGGATTGWTTLAITSVMTECGFTRLEPMGVCRRTAPSRPEVTTSCVTRTWKPALRRRWAAMA